ncbi:restriction endonuclease subunit S [Providencia rettgeri]|uniref:restriction endonuclease subunit S n=1 Tax=Providencia stuartii TaxID=588 RepID=UPI0024ABD153|nr:restriction endonuclease subunit S [Providencia stuartii]MCX3069103.1 restriction endonuclease subunit S [Providencia stuartii]
MVIKPLGEIINVLTDYHANGAYKKLKDNVELLEQEEFALMIRTTNLEAQDYENNLIYITKKAYDFLSKSKVYPNDLIMNKIANAGAIYFMPDLNRPVSLGMNLFLIRVNTKKANPFYVYSYLKENESYVKSFASGSTTKTITKDDVKKLKILLPPLAEQEKIAEILSTWDKAIATTEKLIATSQQQKKALMQQLLTGKKRLVNPETGKVFEGEWENTHLSNIASIKKGKALSAKNLVSGSYPVIAGGKSSPYSHVHFTHENVITVSASGAYAGYVSYHPYKIWASDCSVVTAKPANYLGFIFQWLQLNQIRIYSMQSGGAQPHIYPKDLEVMKLRVPKIEEQQKIASVLTAADKEIEFLEAKLAHLKEEKKALMQQLLTGKRRVKVSETEAA